MHDYCPKNVSPSLLHILTSPIPRGRASSSAHGRCYACSCLHADWTCHFEQAPRVLVPLPITAKAQPNDYPPHPVLPVMASVLSALSLPYTGYSVTPLLILNLSTLSQRFYCGFAPALLCLSQDIIAAYLPRHLPSVSVRVRAP